jgi:hypothetical protein
MKHDLKDVGGTRGGLGMFLLGLGLAVVGGYLLLQQVDVYGGYWSYGRFGTGTSFGLTLIPLLLGVGFLFYDGRSAIGWVLAGAGALILLAGIVANMQIHFRATTLYNTLLMLVLLVGGLGLVIRSLRPVGRD